MKPSIVFSGDFLRPESGRPRPTQHYNIQWCRDLLHRQVELATGCETGMVCWNQGGVVSGGIDHAAVEALYRAAGYSVDMDNWAGLLEEGSCPQPFEEEILRYFDCRMVIGFEMPRYLTEALRKAGTPFIDIVIHPVRFMDDIFFGVRSSAPDINARIAAHAVPEEQISLMAGVQAAAARRNHRFKPDPGSLLFVHQMRRDRSQIRNGKFVSIDDFGEQTDALAARFPKIYIKPHPLEKDTSIVAQLAARFENAEVTGENIYRLLASERIAHVASISSSVGIEARYFGKPNTFLLGPPDGFGDDAIHAFTGVFDAFLTADFWRDILSPVMDTTAQTGVRVPFKPNRLRISQRSFWGFNEIDTDRVLHAGRIRNPSLLKRLGNEVSRLVKGRR